MNRGSGTFLRHFHICSLTFYLLMARDCSIVLLPLVARTPTLTVFILTVVTHTRSNL